MTDAKRTPYRENASPSPAREPKPRGPVVTRAPDPEPDAPTPRKTTPASAARSAPPDPEAGVFSGLVSPHAASTPGEWWAQVAATTIALPLIVSTFLLVGWLDTRRAYSQTLERGHASSPLGIAHPAAWALGATPLVVLGLATRVHWVVVLVAVALPYAALLARRSLVRGITEREVLAKARRERSRS